MSEEEDTILPETEDESHAQSPDSIDIFGLGITLQFIINCLNRHNVLELSDFMRLSLFCNKMYDFNPVTRVIDIDLLLNEYENILLVPMNIKTKDVKIFMYEENKKINVKSLN